MNKKGRYKMEKETIDEMLEEELKNRAIGEFYLEYAKAKEAIEQSNFLKNLEVKTTYNGETRLCAPRRLQELIDNDRIIESDQFQSQQEDFVKNYVNNYKNDLVRKLVYRITHDDLE